MKAEWMKWIRRHIYHDKWLLVVFSDEMKWNFENIHITGPIWERNYKSFFSRRQVKISLMILCVYWLNLHILSKILSKSINLRLPRTPPPIPDINLVPFQTCWRSRKAFYSKIRNRFIDTCRRIIQIIQILLTHTHTHTVTHRLEILPDLYSADFRGTGVHCKIWSMEVFFCTMD